MEAAVMEISSSRWLCMSLPAIASTLGLMLLVANVIAGFADHAIGTGTQIAWQGQLLKVEEALARGDLATAERQWREAYAAALKSQHWQGMVATGDTYRVLGAQAGFRAASVAKARQAYLTALFAARTEGSAEAVLGTPERSAESGDAGAAAPC